MPPFVSTECPNCKKNNRFDLAELKDTSTTVFKNPKLDDILGRITEDEEELTVTCQHCGRKFKITVKKGNP